MPAIEGTRIRKANCVKGIIPPIITPLTDDEKVDEQSLRNLIRFCIGKGAKGILVGGSNGETMALLPEERIRLYKIALDEAGRRIPVICGVMDTGTKRVIENIKRLVDLGGEYAAITPAFYMREGIDKEILLHFEEISKKTDISIMIYNIPTFTGVDISFEVVTELFKIDNIIGIKESSGKLDRIIKCIEKFRGVKRLFQGVTSLAADSLIKGADGFTPVLFPLFHDIYNGLYEAALLNDHAKILFFKKKADMAGKILKASPNATSAAKYAISLIGYTSFIATMPNEPLNDCEKEKISAIVGELLQLEQ